MRARPAPPPRRLRWLALGLALCAGAFATAADSGTTDESHTFTNDSGASFQGQILSVTGDEVTIKRNDGQTFHPKVAIFSKDDQAYIRGWIVKSAAAHGNGVYSFRVSEVDGVATAQPTNNDAHLTTSVQPVHYNLVIQNLTQAEWTSLHVRYIVFVLEANFGELPPNDFTSKRVTGAFDIDKLAPGEETPFPLAKVDVTHYAMKPNNVFTNGAPRTTADKLTGVWVRVYDDDDHLLQEWASDPELMKDERWMFPVARGQRGAPQPGPRPRGNAPGRGAGMP